MRFLDEINEGADHIIASSRERARFRTLYADPWEQKGADAAQWIVTRRALAWTIALISYLVVLILVGATRVSPRLDRRIRRWLAEEEGQDANH